MRINNFLLAVLVTMVIVELNAQTTGLTDDFSNEANSLVILSSGMGMDIEYPVSGSDPTLAMIMNKSIENEELVIDYHWISDAAYNEIRITPPNGTTFDFSSSGQFLTFNYRVGTLFPITFGFKDISGNFTESQTIILEGDGLTHTASFAINTTVPDADYSNIDYMQLVLNTGPNKLNSEVANCILHIDNLVIGDGSFQVNSPTLGISNNVTWTGGTNTDWATAANWDINTVPSATDNVIIPDFATAPIIGATTGAEINNLTITETEGINITAGGSLIVNGTSSGDVTYNRTLGTDNWYLMSSPVVGQTYNDAYVTANSISGNGSNRGIAPYVTSDNSWDYMQASDVDATFTPGSGYSVKRNSPGDVSFTGTLNVADAGVDVTLTNTGNGFNLLGNPYTSHINSATFLANEGAVSETKTLWVWNQANGAYEVKTLGDAMLIAPAQGFFVKANAAGGTFNFAESNQAGSGGTFQKTEARPEMHLTLSNQSDVREAKIYYIENMTSGFDVGYEGELFNGVANPLAIYTHLVADSEGKNYQVQSLPDNDFENTIIPLGINAISGSSISIKASKNNFPEGMNIYLEDKQDNSFTLLEADANFNTTLENDLSGIGRFFLHTTSSTLSANDLAISNNLSIYSSNRETLRVVGVQNGTANLQIFSLLGKEILRSSFEGRGVNDIALPKLAPGVYIVKVKMQTGQLNKKIIIE